MMHRGADLSPCLRYRYRLWRRWGEGGASCVFVMLNPSTADALQDDRTVRRCIGFAQDWGFDRLEVVNLFALRTPYPRTLLNAVRPFGPDNRAHVGAAINLAGIIVCGWGAHGVHRDQDREMMDWIAAHNSGQAPVVALEVNRDGTPKHPLYIRAGTVPAPYRGRPPCPKS